MNFYNNIPNFTNKPHIPGINPEIINNPIINNDINYKIHELEQRIKRIEQKVSRLEADKGNIGYTEPDNSLYMI